MKGHACWQNRKCTYCPEWPKKNSNWGKFKDSAGVEDTATTSAAQRGLKTALFGKGRAFKPAV